MASLRSWGTDPALILSNLSQTTQARFPTKLTQLMKILYVADYQSADLIRRRHITTNIHDGTNAKISRIARGLTARGHRLTIVASGIPARRSGRWSGGFDSFVDGTIIPVHYASSIDMPLLNLGVAAGSMIQWVRHNGPWDRILMYNFDFAPVATCLSLSHSERIPLVVEYEDDAKINLKGESRLQRNKGEWIVGRTQDYIGGALLVTEHLGRHLRTSNVCVLPGIVEDGQLHAACQPRSARPVVVYCGQMSYLKGPDILIGALQGVSHEIDMHLFGGGPMLDEIRKLASRANRHRITVHGRVSEEALKQHIDGADLFVNPHRMDLGHCDSLFPFKVFEYLARGKPVVTSQIAKLSPVVEGALVRYDQDSPHTLAEALNHCLENYGAILARAILAAEEINSQYSVSAASERIEKVLNAA